MDGPAKGKHRFDARDKRDFYAKAERKQRSQSWRYGDSVESDDDGEYVQNRAAPGDTPTKVKGVIRHKSHKKAVLNSPDMVGQIEIDSDDDQVHNLNRFEAPQTSKWKRRNGDEDDEDDEDDEEEEEDDDDEDGASDDADDLDDSNVEKKVEEKEEQVGKQRTVRIRTDKNEVAPKSAEGGNATKDVNKFDKSGRKMTRRERSLSETDKNENEDREQEPEFTPMDKLLEQLALCNMTYDDCRLPAGKKSRPVPARSAFQIFAAEHSGNASKKMEKIWKKSDDLTHSNYRELARKDKLRYQVQFQEWKDGKDGKATKHFEKKKKKHTKNQKGDDEESENERSDSNTR